MGLGRERVSLDNGCRLLAQKETLRPERGLFPCAIAGGDGFYIDPYGNMHLCSLIRKSTFNLLEVDVEDALEKLLPLVRNRKFTSDSKCRSCSLRNFCGNCPGKALLEVGDMEAPVEYYCEQAMAIGQETLRGVSRVC